MIDTGSGAGSVLKKYSSRWVPTRSRLGQRLALDPGPALAGVRRRWLEEVGVGVELSDQR
jgi:hypothetical protein